MSKIKIEDPCHEDWNIMNSVSGGRFCDSCHEKVNDLDELSSIQIIDLLKSKPKVCGKLNPLKTASSIILALTLTITSCTTQNQRSLSTEVSTDKTVKITGKISWSKEVEIHPTSINLITKSKLYTGKIDKNNNFEFEIPESILKSQNLIRINFQKKGANAFYEDYSNHLISKNQLIRSQNLVADNGEVTIGAVVVVSPTPPDFYYFNGKNISKSKYEKLKKENTKLVEIKLYDDVYKNVITSEDSDTISLLYSTF